MDFSCQMSKTEAVGDDQDDFVMLIAVGTSERRAQSLSRYRRHAEAKSEENKEYGDGSESHMI